MDLTKDQFKNYIAALQEVHRICTSLNSDGLDVINFMERLNKPLHLLQGAVFDKETLETIEWWLYDADCISGKPRNERSVTIWDSNTKKAIAVLDTADKLFDFLKGLKQ